jgi:sodium-dependent dicarboxylate transporter 2/3/5
VTEAIPIGATSVLPVVLFPLLGVESAKEAAAPYGHPMVFLFLGGMFIARTIERWGLHRRIALKVVSVVGVDPARVVLGFMIAAAFLSMWISNTATTLMMMPIAAAVIREVGGTRPGDETRFSVALLLGIAYGSSIGGTGTLVGTPPNVVFKGMMEELVPGAPPVAFVTWMQLGLPFVAIMIPVVWLYLTRVASPLGREERLGTVDYVRRALADLGPMTRPERRTLVVFAATVVLWVTRARIDLGFVAVPGWSDLLGTGGRLDDAAVAVGMAVLLFALPAGDPDSPRRGGRRLLDWETAVQVPWAIILLIGGGFSLAHAVQTSGLGGWLGTRLAALGDVPPVAWIGAVTGLTTFLTEVTSNTATTTTLLPILAHAAQASGIAPVLLMVPATLAASCAFMLPVATPPNAIVYGTGNVRIATMARVGVGLNLIAIVVITLVSLLLVGPVLGG